MIKLIKSGFVYGPDSRGKNDILIIGSKIADIGQDLDMPSGVGNVEVIDATNKFVFPGFIDGHLHTIGAGGQAGPRSRATEIKASTVIGAGITTVVGSLGFDSTSRSLAALVMKAKDLRDQGINSYMVTGSFAFPSPTVLPSIEEDIALIDEIVGLKMALGEASSSFPSEDDLLRNMSAVRRGALLGGKPGVVYMHMGDASTGWFEKLRCMFDRTSIPIQQLVLMHVNRKESILKAAASYAKAGGQIDLTAVISPPERPNTFSIGDALSYLWSVGVKNSSITATSDGNAGRTLDNGQIALTDINALLYQLTKVMKEEGKITEALELVTCNAAARIGLSNRKGMLRAGMDADIILLSNEWELLDVIAMGKCLMRQGNILIQDNL